MYVSVLPSYMCQHSLHICVSTSVIYTENIEGNSAMCQHFLHMCQHSLHICVITLSSEYNVWVQIPSETVYLQANLTFRILYIN